MALLTRSRRSDAPAAEVLDRAREVSEQLGDRAREVREAAEPRIAQAREAAEPRIAQAREAAEPRIARAREAAEPRIARARDVAEPVVDRAREASAPALAGARRGLGAAFRLLVRVVALLPGFGARVLELVARLLGRLADRSAELAHVEPPSHAGRRRRRTRAALWFVGGFATGAAAGYAVSEMNRDHHDHEHDATPWQPEAANTSTPAQG